MAKVRVKICCISSVKEAKQAIAAGADAVGLVGNMPSGPGVISDNEIAAITATVPPPIATFLLTSEIDSKTIIRHYRKVQTSTIQIVDALSSGTYQEIRTALPHVKLVQVIHVIDESSIEEVVKIAPHVDAILLDSGNPNLKVKELGGTGRTHNWAISRRIRAAVDKPIFLAGGLKASNIRAAVDAVQPFGVDLCSGVRTNGQLDTEKLKAFFEALNEK